MFGGAGVSELVAVSWIDARLLRSYGERRQPSCVPGLPWPGIVACLRTECLYTATPGGTGGARLRTRRGSQRLDVQALGGYDDAQDSPSIHIRDGCPGRD